MIEKFNLEKCYADELIAHARSESPNECCGILAGFNGKVIKLFRTTNSKPSPYGYMIEPLELISVYQEMREKAWDLLAIYHSHTHTEAYPSPVDIKSAVLTQPLYLIISLAYQNKPAFRGFCIADGQVSEIELKITGM